LVSACGHDSGVPDVTSLPREAFIFSKLLVLPRLNFATTAGAAAILPGAVREPERT
jgi:hypothetical protein